MTAPDEEGHALPWAERVPDEGGHVWRCRTCGEIFGGPYPRHQEVDCLASLRRQLDEARGERDTLRERVEVLQGERDLYRARWSDALGASGSRVER